MKKLLIVPVLLALIIFSLYHEDVDGMDSSTKAKVSQDIQIEEGILEIYNNSKDEINTTSESNKSIEKEFSVEIKGDFNTTKETLITLTALVKNAQKIDACNYFWYENNNLISMGKTLESSFEKGEHNVTLVVRDANGEERNASVMIRAYDYYSVTTLNYDAHYGNLLHTERVIYNHKGQHLLFDNGTYSITLLFYDDNNNMTERVLQYYNYPEENTNTKYTYDDKGNRLSRQTFNSMGESVNYVLNVYDDNSTLLDVKYGTSPDDIDEAPVYSNVYTDVYSEGVVVYDASNYVEVEVPKDIVQMNDNKQVIYEERYYGDMKVINKMSYNEENKLVKSERSSTSSFETSSTIIEFDLKGNALNTEKQYAFKGHGSCHYRSSNTYMDTGSRKTNVSVVLGGECPSYIDEVKREFTYDKDGSVVSVKAITDDGDVDEGFTTLTVIKEYTNNLDI